MEKEPCNCKAKIDDTVYYCNLYAGHFGPHRTYLGNTLWPWHWRSNGK